MQGFGKIPEELKNMPHLRSTYIREFRKSPRHYFLREDIQETPSMKLGTAFHTALLEPEKYQKNYVEIPSFEKKSKYQTLTIKEQLERWKEENKDSVTISSEDRDKVKMMLASCLDNPIINKIVNNEHALIEKEFYMVKDEICYTGTPDIIIPELNLVIDVKTTTDASPNKWSKAIHDREYMIQAALYIDAMNAIFGKEFNRFIWVVVENKHPYSAMTYFAEPSLLDLGRNLILNASSDFKNCLLENNWPSYKTGLVPCSLPVYAWSQYESEE